jgi:hypothetical protein
VLWNIVSVFALGVVLGLSFRAPTLLAATAVTIAVTGLLFDGPLLPRVLVPVLGLQCGYLVGAVLANLWKRFAHGGR